MSKFFSLAPWTSMYIKPNGNVYPCESVGWFEHDTYCVGNIESNTIEEMWNHPVYREMRLSVLNTNRCKIQDGQGGLEIGCTYLQLRELYNTDISFYKEATSAEGYYYGDMQTLYIERSNVCNLTCLYCNSISSNSWAKLKNEPSIKRIPDNIYWNKLTPHLDKLKEINISGGEPVLDPFNEKVLDYLLEYNNNIQINMTTNLTYDFDKKLSFFNKLNSFNRIPKIACSVDSKDEIFETIRRNSAWPLVYENLYRLKEYKFYNFFCIAVSILNCFSLREFHDFLIDKGLATIDSIRYQPVCFPEFLSMRFLSAEKKQKLKVYFLKYAASLIKREQQTPNLNLWCNGGKSVSQAIINFADRYLYGREGKGDYRDILLKELTEEILLQANL